MSRTLAALLFSALLPLSAHAGEHRDAVMDLLNAIDSTTSEADLKALGDGVEAELKEIADDGEVATSRRGRAISALQYYPSAESRTFLEAKLETGDKSLYRRKAAGALGAGWGEPSVEVLAPYLADKDEQLRMAVARTLGSVGGDAARGALEARLKKEKADAVKETLEAALAEVSK